MRARGNRGELAAALEADDAVIERFRDVELWDGSRRESFRIERIWPHKGRMIFKFEGVDTISQAERLAGREVQIPAERRPAAPAGRYYLTDLVGCRVQDARSGQWLGEVRGVIETGGALVLEVGVGERELLIPFAASICVEIAPEKRLIRVELPEGLEAL